MDEIRIADIISTNEALGHPRAGLAASATLIGAAEIATAANKTESAQRLNKAALAIINLDNFESLSATDIMNDPSSYNLTDYDIEILKGWYSQLTNYETIFEPKYGTMRSDAFRRIVVEKYLNKDITGVLLEGDVVGLKGFNTYGRECGDEAIIKSVLFWTKILNELYPHCNCPIGRAGDELYIFIPNQDAVEVKGNIDRYIIEHRDELRQITAIQITTPGSERVTKHAVNYWDTTNVTKNTFDQKRLDLENSIELQKVQKSIDAIQQIRQDDHSLELLINYLVNEKRMPVELVKELIDNIIKQPQIDADTLIQSALSTGIIGRTRELVENIISQ